MITPLGARGSSFGVLDHPVHMEAQETLTTNKVVVILDIANIVHHHTNDLKDTTTPAEDVIKQSVAYFEDLPCVDEVKVVSSYGFINNTPSVLGLFDSMKNFFRCPGGNQEDDKFMLAEANRLGGFIVSNDRFIEHEAMYARDWLSFHRIGFWWSPEFGIIDESLQKMKEFREGRSDARFAPMCGLNQNFHRQQAMEALAYQVPNQQTAPVSPVPVQDQGLSGHHFMYSPSLAVPQQTIPVNHQHVEASARINGSPQSMSSKHKTSDMQVVKVINVPHIFKGRIIGVEGHHIKELQQRTSTRISVGNEVDATQKVEVKITGATQWNVSEAVKIVEAKVKTWEEQANGGNHVKSFSQFSNQPKTETSHANTQEFTSSTDSFSHYGFNASMPRLRSGDECETQSYNSVDLMDVES